MLGWMKHKVESRLPGEISDMQMTSPLWQKAKKGATEDEMVGWHHRLNGLSLSKLQGDSEGQRNLVCCSPRGHKDSDTDKWLSNNREVDFTCCNWKRKKKTHMLKLKIIHVATKALHAAPKTWHSTINKQIKYFFKVWMKKTRSYLVNTIFGKKLKLWDFNLYLRLYIRKLTTIISIQHFAGGFGQYNRQEKEINVIRVGQKGKKKI